jgi:hypothetical protein
MSLVQGQYCKNMAFFGPYELLGSQGIVVKCTAAIFFPTADCDGKLTDDRPTPHLHNLIDHYNT